ncbi:MAG: N-acetylmuramic acid 6-phosphate etherase [Bacteroidota bacterium]
MKYTEQASNYDDLEQMSTRELLSSINQEDKKVPEAVSLVIPYIERLVEAALKGMKGQGRLIYMGSGTSGRLGVVDASECPPTYGVAPGKVIGLIAGGKEAVYSAVEHAEDSLTQGWKDLQELDINPEDFVIGIAASGSTPYVLGAMDACRAKGIATGCITCNSETDLAAKVDYPIEVIVGPEFVTGSTRMKAGTAQKLVLNMISTSLMIKLGHVKGNKMLDMQLSNNKLVDRGSRMIMEKSELDYEAAKSLLLKEGSVRAALISLGIIL